MYAVLIIFGIIVALGWIAYGIWLLWIRPKEEGPEPKPEYLQKKKESFDNYIDKLKHFKKKNYKRKQDG